MFSKVDPGCHKEKGLLRYQPGATAMVQARDDGGLDRVDKGAGGETWSD